MGNRFNNHNLHQRGTTNGIFIPMLCSRSSSTIKDVHVITKWAPDQHVPSSPKVSCIGQVIKNNNKVRGSQTPPLPHHKLTPTAIKYHKLKRLFSGKSLTTPTRTVITSVAEADCKKPIKRSVSNAHVDITALDPPLPVVKREAGEGVNLWKRRSSAAALKRLQLQNNYLCDYKINNVP